MINKQQIATFLRDAAEELERGEIDNAYDVASLALEELEKAQEHDKRPEGEP